MEDVLTVQRELYLDVELQGAEIAEIYIYQVDFSQEGSFHTREYSFRKEKEEAGKEEAEKKTDKDETKQEAKEQPSPLEQFFHVFFPLSQQKVNTEYYATDAVLVTEQLLEPVKKLYPGAELPKAAEKEGEWLHDCISMARVVPMSFFDEKQYLGAGIRRRMKERYHPVAEDIKKDKPFRLFLSLEPDRDKRTETLFATVTGEDFSVAETIQINVKSNEELLASKLGDLLQRYSELDILANRYDARLYSMFRKMHLYMKVRYVPVITSLTSMLHALGKDAAYIHSDAEGELCEKKQRQEDVNRGNSTPDSRALVADPWIFVYRFYIRNAEQLKNLGHCERISEERLYFYLPVRISSVKNLKKQWKKNRIWKQKDEDTWELLFDENIRAKYIMKSGEEQFALKVNAIYLRRYLKEYAVLFLETENRTYPGRADRERIRQLGASLHLEEADGIGASGRSDLPGQLELKIRVRHQTYTITARPMGNHREPSDRVWLSGLLLLGEKKIERVTKKTPFLYTCADSFFVTDKREEGREEALVRDEYLNRIEEQLTEYAKPKTDRKRTGKLGYRQKRQIRYLFEAFRYLTVSYAQEDRKHTSEAAAEIEAHCGTKETIDRLTKKFEYYR